MVRALVPTSETTPFALFHWDRRFFVPDFQRPFSWAGEEIRDFWEDLNPVLAGAQKELFLGTIVLETSEAGKAVVWDGQQRLAILVMYLCAGRDYLLLGGAKDDLAVAAEINTVILGGLLAPVRSPVLTLGELDQQTFHDFALIPAGDLAKKDGVFWKGLPVTQRRAHWSPKVVDAFEGIKQQVSAYAAASGKRHASPNAAIRELVQSLLNKIRLVKFETVSEEEAFRIFEVLNDRGLELSAADLIKNFLLSRASQNAALRIAMKQQWDRMSRIIGPERLTAFIRHFYMSRYGRTTKSDLYGRIVKLCSGTQGASVQVDDLLTDLSDIAEFYARIVGIADGNWNSLALGESMETLNRLGATQWTPLILAAHSLGGGEPEFEQITSTVESVFVRSVLVGGKNPNSLERLFADTASQMWRSVKVEPTPVSDQVAWETAIKAVRKTVPPDDEFRARFMELSEVSGSTAKLLLEKIERFRQKKASGGVIPQLNVLDLEHIYPRTDGPDWPKKGKPGYVDPIERESLGNLTLLHLRPNRQQRNAGFAKKKAIYAASPILITKSLAEFPEWNSESISKRQIELGETAVQAWPGP